MWVPMSGFGKLQREAAPISEVAIRILRLRRDVRWASLFIRAWQLERGMSSPAQSFLPYFIQRMVVGGWS